MRHTTGIGGLGGYEEQHHADEETAIDGSLIGLLLLAKGELEVGNLIHEGGMGGVFCLQGNIHLTRVVQTRRIVRVTAVG